jgi:hypothetical protein
MKKFAAPLIALGASTLSLAAAAESFAGSAAVGSFLNSNPDPSIAWPLAIGFLGLVVLRRTRTGPMS